MAVKKKIAAVAAAATMAMSVTAISASASTPASFSLHYTSDTDKTVLQRCTVTGLSQNYDTGIEYTISTYVGGGNGTYVKGDLDVASLKKNPKDFVLLNGRGDKGVVIFVDDWYAKAGSTVTATVALTDIDTSRSISATGTAK